MAEAGSRRRLLDVFIVEDSAVILENLSATLEELAPVRVVGSAADETTAVAWLQAHGERCDLVLLDVYLRAGSGFGVLASAARSKLRAPRVVLSNYATPEMRERCLSLGAHRVLDKSNELDELLALCKRLADGADETAAVRSAG